MAPYHNDSDDKQLRLIAALCYLSSGIVGLIYVLLNGRNNRSQFFLFHFYQALFLGILMVLFGWAGGGITSFVIGILGLFGSALAPVTQIVATVLGFLLQGISLVMLVANLFGLVQSLRGKYADMPVVTKIVRSNMR